MKFRFLSISFSITLSIEVLIPLYEKSYLPTLCASIQHTIVEVLIKKITKASSELGINEIAIAGGVSANSYLRKRLIELQKIQKKNVFIPKFEYCTDNAAMIAITGYYQFLEKDFSDQSVTPTSRLKL